MSKTSKASINLDNLDLNRTYNLEEFEYINNQLKNRTLKVDGQPVNLFELDENGKLVPMPQMPYSREKVVAEIARQLSNWNIQTQQGGGVTTSQGGYDLNVGHNQTIRVPDIAFVSKETDHRLTELQRWTFQGGPFTPIFVVEVNDLGSGTDDSKFIAANKRFKEEFFAPNTSVQLGWLIDPQHYPKRIYIYRRGQNRSNPRWEDISGENVLPGFRLQTWKIDELISPAPSAPQSESGEFACPKCDEIFDSDYEFSIHFEDVHIRKHRRIQE